MKKVLLIFTLITGLLSFAQLKNFSGKNISIKEFETKIQHAMDSLQVQGMSVGVINDNKIVYNKGFGYADIALKKKVDHSTFFEAASLSKPVFAFFVLTLAKEGKLNLDRPLFEYLPNENIADERYKKITARMVLSHTTGLPNWSETEKMKLESEPGQKFSYSGEAFMYLAKVIAELSGSSLKNLDNIFQNEVSKPLKLKDFHFIVTDKAEENLAKGYQKKQLVKDERDRSLFDSAGGMYANIENYGQFLISLMNQQKKYAEMFKTEIQLEKNHPIAQYFGISSWTLGLAVVKINNSENFWHGGNNLGYTSSFMINPEKKFGYVFFTNEDQCNGMKKVLEDLLWK
ncbi:serine hydrolase domain-containing protein [Chryseobacterium sp. RLHN22]|uniref:serine hydrolase domain-containing protein n=1 Tax=Chryseobacterium sp. RLHN22 TaxID=3437885 RepID=UPI003D9BD5D7